MKQFLYFAFLLMTITTTDLSGQTLSIEDMVKTIRQFKDYKSMKGFIEKHGFDFDTTLVPNKISKIYSFLSAQEFSVIGLDEDTIKMNNAIFIRLDEGVTLRKLTLMTGVKAYYEQLVVDMVQKKFKAREHQDKSKPMSYTSVLYNDIGIALSVVEAVKEEKRYARYQIVVNY